MQQFKGFVRLSDISTKLMKKIQIITRYEFLKLIRGIDGKQTTFISIYTITKQKLNTRGLNNPYGSFIYKLSKVVGLINFNYKKMVNKKDKTYQVKERIWGRKSKDYFNGTLVDHKENDYITIAIQQTLYKSKYLTTEGKLIGKENFTKFIPVKKESYVEKELNIFFRNYRIESIIKCTIHGKTYRIID
jgi:hypothetical protein